MEFHFIAHSSHVTFSSTSFNGETEIQGNEVKKGGQGEEMEFHENICEHKENGIVKQKPDEGNRAAITLTAVMTASPTVPG